MTSRSWKVMGSSRSALYRLANSWVSGELGVLHGGFVGIEERDHEMAGRVVAVSGEDGPAKGPLALGGLLPLAVHGLDFVGLRGAALDDLNERHAASFLRLSVRSR
jgi:hypothetical protein